MCILSTVIAGQKPGDDELPPSDRPATPCIPPPPPHSVCFVTPHEALHDLIDGVRTALGAAMTACAQQDAQSFIRAMGDALHTLDAVDRQVETLTNRADASSPFQ